MWHVPAFCRWKLHNQYERPSYALYSSPQVPLLMLALEGITQSQTSFSGCQTYVQEKSKNLQISTDKDFFAAKTNQQSVLFKLKASQHQFWRQIPGCSCTNVLTNQALPFSPTFWQRVNQASRKALIMPQQKPRRKLFQAKLPSIRLPATNTTCRSLSGVCAVAFCIRSDYGPRTLPLPERRDVFRRARLLESECLAEVCNLMSLESKPIVHEDSNQISPAKIVWIFKQSVSRTYSICVLCIGIPTRSVLRKKIPTYKATCQSTARGMRVCVCICVSACVLI